MGGGETCRLAPAISAVQAPATSMLSTSDICGKRSARIDSAFAIARSSPVKGELKHRTIFETKEISTHSENF